LFVGTAPTREEKIERLGHVHAAVGAAQRERLAVIAELRAYEDWEREGARDLPHYLCLQLGISEWKARRMIDAARALDRLPRIAEALAWGALSEEKVLELCRFATPEEEERLVDWATTVSGAWIRRKADLVERQRREDAEAVERERRIEWWFSGDRFHLEIDTSRAEGMRILKRLRTEAERIPAMPGEEHDSSKGLLDAAVALLTSTRDGFSADATVVIHARLDDLLSAERAASLDGEAISPHTARRALCASRFRLLLEGERGEPLKLGRLRRDPTPAMRELVIARDGGCTFPNCGSNRYLQVHHTEWWAKGGSTDVEKLATICGFHHKLVHEYGWKILRTSHTTWWYRPDGTRYRAGPAPPIRGNEGSDDGGYVISAIAAAG
jgi:hypothetical protein